MSAMTYARLVGAVFNPFSRMVGAVFNCADAVRLETAPTGHGSNAIVNQYTNYGMSISTSTASS